MTEKDIILKGAPNKEIEDSITELRNKKKKVIENLQNQFQIQLDSEIIEEMIKSDYLKHLYV